MFKTNGHIYEALIRTILLYGCETWTAHVEDAVVSVLYLWSFFNAAYAGLATLSDGPQVKSSERSSAQPHCRPGGNAGGAAN